MQKLRCLVEAMHAVSRVKVKSAFVASIVMVFTPKTVLNRLSSTRAEALVRSKVEKREGRGNEEKAVAYLSMSLRKE